MTTGFRPTSWRDRHTGRVEEFSTERGLGVLATTDGPLGFHCTAIADGSRRIDVGAEVSFVRRPGRLGVDEGWDIRPR